MIAKSITRLFTIGMLITLAAFCMSAGVGCKPKIRYLPGSNKVIVLEKGDQAPCKGYFTTQQGMADYYDWLEKNEVKPD